MALLEYNGFIARQRHRTSVFSFFQDKDTERVYMALLEYNGFIARQRNRASIHSFIARQRHRASIHSFIARQPHRASIHKFMTRQRHRASIHSFIARQRHRASIYTALLQDKDAELVYTALRIHDVNSTRLTSVTVFNFTPSRTLRSASDTLSLQIPRTRRSTVGFRAFSVFGPANVLYDRSPIRLLSNQPSIHFFFFIFFSFLFFCLQKQ